MLGHMELQYPSHDYPFDVNTCILGSVHMAMYYFLAEFRLRSLATWMAANGSTHILQHELADTRWGHILSITSLSISLIINAVVTGLIVLRILKVCWIREDQTFGLGIGGTKLRSIIFLIMESGVMMFLIQLIRVITTIFDLHGVYFIVGIDQMLNVIINLAVTSFHIT